MPEAELVLRSAYQAFNARDVEAAVALMHPDVDWPNAWEGGRVVGRAAVRDYWNRQFAAISSKVEPEGFTEETDGSITVEVRQVVHDARTGDLISDSHVRHRYRLVDGLVVRMDVLEAPATAERNVEIVRQVYECVNQRRWDEMAELLDPNVAQYGTVGGLEEGTVVRGRREIAQSYEREADAWDRQRIEPERLIDAGDRVVVFQREYQRGRSSGLELVVETAAVVDLRNGRVVRIQGYMDRAAALRAVGLPEEETYSSP